MSLSRFNAFTNAGCRHSPCIHLGVKLTPTVSSLSSWLHSGFQGRDRLSWRHTAAQQPAAIHHWGTFFMGRMTLVMLTSMSAPGDGAWCEPHDDQGYFEQLLKISLWLIKGLYSWVKICGPIRGNRGFWPQEAWRRWGLGAGERLVFSIFWEKIQCGEERGWN